MDILLSFISILLSLLLLLIVIRSILSWFSIQHDNPYIILLYQITEPILAPLRRVVPKIGLLDTAPLAAIFIIWVLMSLVAWFSTQD